jgi:hypothetical protein
VSSNRVACPPVHICACLTRIYVLVISIPASDTVSSAPRQFTPSSDIETGFGDFPDGNLVEIDLPWAMKLFRVPGVR